MNGQKKQPRWVDAYAVNFHRLHDGEIREIERELKCKELKGLTQGEVHKAVVALKRNGVFAGPKPSPYDIKRQIIRNRETGNNAKDFNFDWAKTELRQIPDPLHRWNWIIDNSPQSMWATDNVIPRLEAFCKGLPGGIQRYVADLTFSNVGRCDKSRPKITEKAKREARNKLKGFVDTETTL